jgi:hypothetical protein
MKSEGLNVVVGMPHYWLAGRMPVSGIRLHDLMARTNTDFISLADATIFNDESDKVPLAQLSDILIPKRQVLCITAIGNEHEAPVKRLYNFQARDQSSVVLIADNYLIEGLAHLPKSASGVAYSLYRDCGLFISLTNAIVRSGNSKPIKFPFLLVNSELLRTVGLSKTSPTAASVLQQANPQLNTRPSTPPLPQDCTNTPDGVIAQPVTT